MIHSMIGLFYIYVKTNGDYPNLVEVEHPDNYLRVCLNRAEDRVRAIYNRRFPNAEVLSTDRDELLQNMSAYLGRWYDLDEAFVSEYWALCEIEIDDQFSYLAMSNSDDKLLELLPRIAEFTPYHEVREAISSMRRMTDNGFFNVLGRYTDKAETMREQMLKDMETVTRFIERYRGV